MRHLTGDTINYGAFIIFGDGTNKFVSLGNETEVTQSPSHIWKKINLEIPGISEVFFCPDGVLHTIGIEFLNPDMGRKIHRVFHLSDIQQPIILANSISLIGVSDHNSPIGEGETLYRGEMTDLPGVKYEIELVKNALYDMPPIILFNDDATEMNVKNLMNQNVAAVHFSTHGFFRDHQSLLASSSDSEDFDYNMSRRVLSNERTNISGLVLRGGNLSWKAKEILEDEDDLLTAEEIETMSLPQLQLTVLSACDTGLGKVDSEGVWGLQRAFRIAGSKSVLCTLRKVSDYATALFMEEFYGKINLGCNVYDAFRHAQSVLYHEYPDEPDIWTSYILIE